jgi:hypothetical protein
VDLLLAKRQRPNNFYIDLPVDPVIKKVKVENNDF